ncbi:hypothetical protein TI04_09095 [Achromatium sp. WMS2]|nr:hypothetical protein TI04_09095 [Achromatium sp. WMS2]
MHLGAVWPGIEVSLSARGNNVEKLFTLAPGADPNAIQLAVAGGELSINTGGSLEVAHGDKPLVSFTSPIAWQINTDGTKQAVRVNYRLAGNSRQIYGFSLENYDATRPVFIDPIIQSTYLGGTNADYIHALAVTNNAVYVAGYTYSTNFPQTSGSAQSTSGGGNYDGIIAKLNLELTSIIQSSYLGGTSDDYINAIATNNEAVYVTGYTTSTDFPQTSGGAQPNHGGGYRDGIVAKLNLDLTSVMQNSYLGGSNSDHLRALAVTSEAVYVSGQTTSTDFPETSGGAQPAGGLVDDGIIVKLDLGLTNIIQGSYLGGSRSDYIYALVATSDAVYVAGYTRSDDFPRTNGGAQPNWGGGTYYLNNFLSYYSDGIIAKLNLGLTSILQSSYLGSVGEDHIYALAVTNDAVYVAGDAGSLTFPAISNGAQPAHGGGTNDGMVARLNLELTNVIQSSYLGGSNSDVINALAITDESVYVTGYTWSTNFPTTSDGVQTNYGGGSYDGMITKLNLGLTSIVQSSYLGGIGYDELKTIVITNDGVYVAGSTSSNNFPRTSGGVQPASGGNWDGIITKITLGINAFCQQCLPNHGGWRAILR